MSTRSYSSILAFLFSSLSAFAAAPDIKAPKIVDAQSTVKVADLALKRAHASDTLTVDDQEASGYVVGSNGSGITKQVAIDESIVNVPEMSCAKESLSFDLGNVRGKYTVRWKPETFYGKNIHMLNNNIPADRILYERSTIDVNMHLLYGKKCFGEDVTEFFMSMRNKFIWGDPETIIETTQREIRILNVLDGNHSHNLTRLPLWIREIWLSFNVNKALNLTMPHTHTFTLGLFPFELGRGISFGTAYAVNPGVLGFYSNTTIDQYAPAFKLTGNVVSDTLEYDLYAAILEDLSDSFRNTTAKVKGQQYGRRNNPQRGFGKIDYLIASRLQWRPIDEKTRLVHIEPYGFYNHVPEQQVEFIADASSKLATFGLAAEFMHNRIQVGFDAAFNTGSQHVFGWDRNSVRFENNEGYVTEVNTQVAQGSPTGPLVLFVPGSDTQKAITSSTQSASQNGKEIAPGIFNKNHRFTDSYNNALKGWMAVADASFAFDHGVKLCGAVGVASGDENPNKDHLHIGDSEMDGDYKGFIGLQEIYSGSRVKSAFVLGGAGRLPRPLSTPFSEDVFDTLPTNTSFFTNIVFTGASIEWNPKCWNRYVYVKPNILAYWQQHATKAFDINTGKNLPTDASKYLGYEVNLFSELELMADFRFFAVGSVFIPGTHYKDIKGKPLNSEQKKILDNAIKNGANLDNLPLISNDAAYTFNIGLDIRF